MNNDVDVLEAIRSEVALLISSEVDRGSVVPASLLVEELGLDSMKLARLVARLERVLGLREFPMQAWIDGCSDDGQPLSVESLASALTNALSGQP